MSVIAASTKNTAQTNLELIERFRDYLWLERGLSDNTIQSYCSDIRIFANWLDDNGVTLVEVASVNVLEYLASRVQAGTSSKTTARLLSSLKRFFMLLAREDIIDADPTALVDAPKTGRSLPVSLTQAQVELLLAAPDLETPEGLRDRAMLELTYSSGLRVSELIALGLTQVISAVR